LPCAPQRIPAAARVHLRSPCLRAPGDTGASTLAPTDRPGRSRDAARSPASGTVPREWPRSPAPYAPRARDRQGVVERASAKEACSARAAG